jgi:hypothetical protein
MQFLPLPRNEDEATLIAKAYSQQQLAEKSQAEGQCAHCGAYRLDGRPPVLHGMDCPDRNSEKVGQWEWRYFLEDLERRYPLKDRERKL